MVVTIPPPAQRPVVAREARRVRTTGPAGLRHLVKLLHRLLGLGAGALLVISGLTGSALVFREEIDAALNPRLLRVVPSAQRASLADILDDVARRYPGEDPARVRMPRTAAGTYEVWLGTAPARYVYADPYRDGALLGAREPTEFLTGWLFLLHSHLLSGETGNVVAGVGALALVVLSLSGLVMWWPRGAPWRAWSRWRGAVTIAGQAGSARRLFDLHRALGFYASALLLLAGVTGASLVFHDAFERASYWITATSPPQSMVRAPASRVLPGDRPLPVDSLVAIARRAQPNGVPSYLYLPTAPLENFRLRQRLPGETHPRQELRARGAHDRPDRGNRGWRRGAERGTALQHPLPAAHRDRWRSGDTAAFPGDWPLASCPGDFGRADVVAPSSSRCPTRCHGAGGTRPTVTGTRSLALRAGSSPNSPTLLERLR